ncbi:hypothetical protein PIB30_076015, partial [Stylosanthes scabra]|nr:hypothetical protein [Stylosanthes scabra]
MSNRKQLAIEDCKELLDFFRFKAFMVHERGEKNPHGAGDTSAQYEKIHCCH